MAKYKGKSVSLNKPRRIAKGETSYGKKKSVVYVMDGDRVKRVTFGDPNMRIKKNQKGNRKSFRSRHKYSSFCQGYVHWKIQQITFVICGNLGR